MVADTDIPHRPAVAVHVQVARNSRGAKLFWMRQFTNWHWISAALSLLSLTGFAITGITLNHAGDILARPVTHEVTKVLPAPLQTELATAEAGRRHALPAAVAAWLDQQLKVHTAQREAEWSADEIYFTMTQPGGDSWIRIDRKKGEATYSATDRGWISFFNDLHKGRNTGPWWNWFIDIFGSACVVFSLTGFGLLWLKAPARRSTWPLISVGVVLPVLLVIFLLH